MKKRVPDDMWKSCLVSFDDIDEMRKLLDLKNRLVSMTRHSSTSVFHIPLHLLLMTSSICTDHGIATQVGYTFLIDQEYRIRWKSVGYVQQHELKALFDAVSKLSNKH